MVGPIQRGATSKSDNGASRKGVGSTSVFKATVREDGVASVDFEGVENPVNANGRPADMNAVVLGVSVQGELPVNQLPESRNDGAAIWQRILSRITDV
jgi:hypothetical protein